MLPPERLLSATFSIPEIGEALGLDRVAVRNLIRTSRPHFIETDPIRIRRSGGRPPRMHRYLDAVSIGLILALRDLIAKPEWCGRAVANLMFSDLAFARHRAEVLGPPLSVEYEREIAMQNVLALLRDLRNAPEAISNRDRLRPCFIAASLADVRRNSPYLATFNSEVSTDHIAPGLLHLRIAGVVNATSVLADMDARLIAILDRREAA